MELGVAFAILLVCIVVGVPVVYSFGAATIWLVLTLGFDASFVFTTVYSKMNSSVLIAIPLFIILGAIMEKGGVGSALVNFVEAFTGRVKGALCAVAARRLCPASARSWRRKCASATIRWGLRRPSWPAPRRSACLSRQARFRYCLHGRATSRF